uniref:J domain-containing protein n=1 Tax=Chromera velia CCMP2878 TaxID=1169474 RepID=A0A0G4I5Q7_9ALVE|eukprot:Cvel_11204.t1-p1 / transcript=Cvel_11204.t1 / gene=Cvel_11204 / organism=Chromera_velia_CCMP2878 / gene_product=DnaJ homolog subfamily C member 7 homolog, putative / transcript_product=DnaJ homolog subfamily C member 7 homolog, putative / location=Cvel_scaffold696:51999-57172(+) / protein_length=1168 / sequence_SO=supercontig / SO=protein_coding / is_pseudo=false
MALVGPGALETYTGGPSRQRRRGFVTVSEPALGFFLTGSSIDELCGIYVGVRNESIVKINKDYEVLLAYRNDVAPHWSMVLVQPRQSEEQKKAARERKVEREKRRRERMRRRMSSYYGGWMDSDESESEDEDDMKKKREWLLIDTKGRDRFRHDGDTIIPGAGVSWKHLHRPTPKFQDDDDDDEDEEDKDEEEDEIQADSDDDEADYKSTKSKEDTEEDADAYKSASSSSRQPSREIEVQQEDDEDELPWQVIAILDRETVADMRHYARCYEANIRVAKSGSRLPKPSLLDLQNVPDGCWLYKVVCSGLSVHTQPERDAPVIGWKDRNEMMHVVERKGDWLRLKEQEDSYGMMRRRAGNLRAYYGLINNSADEDDEEWVFSGGDGAGKVQELSTEDLPSMEKSFEGRENTELAEMFDRPFEPMICDAEGRKEAEEHEQEKEKREDQEEIERRKRIAEAAEKYLVVALPAPDTEFPVGTSVGLEGLMKAAYNGRAGEVVAPPVEGEDGSLRQGVRIDFPDGKPSIKISVKTSNLRRLVEGEEGDLGRHARVLGLSLCMLGLVPASSEGEKDALLCRAATQTTAAESSADLGASGTASPMSGDEERDSPRALQKKSGHQVSPAIASELLECAMRAAMRDTSAENVAASSDIKNAHSCLLAAVQETHSKEAKTPTAAAAAESVVSGSSDEAMGASVEGGGDAVPIVTLSAPHEAVERGALGGRAAEAAKTAGCSQNMQKIIDAVEELRKILIDEQRRMRAEGKRGGKGNESPDALRLRLTIIRGLLRCRRDKDLALREAAAACEMHPDSAAAMFWHARCLLRVGRRTDGIKNLSKAANLASAPAEASHSPKPSDWGPDGAWAVSEAASKLTALRLMERHERRAKDAYGRGLFPVAVEEYTEAITHANALADDKWARAELHAHRAACLRRARDLPRAIADLEVSISLFPCYKRALFRHGVCSLEAEKPEGAITSFETLMGLDREWPHLLDWLVRAHAAQRRQSGDYSSRIYGADHSTDYQDREGWAQAAGEGDIAAEKDHYSVLGVSRDVTEKQLKKAYRLMSLKYHPDKEGGSTRAFQRVAEAYDTLNDPEKRQRYDDGEDLRKKRRDTDSDSEDEDDERKKKSLREEIERKYFPERYKFWPFGDPFVEKRKRQERQRQKQGKPAWWEENF